MEAGIKSQQIKKQPKKADGMFGSLCLNLPDHASGLRVRNILIYYTLPHHAPILVAYCKAIKPAKTNCCNFAQMFKLFMSSKH